MLAQTYTNNQKVRFDFFFQIKIFPRTEKERSDSGEGEVFFCYCFRDLFVKKKKLI